MGFVLHINAQTKTTDSTFLRNSRPIEFIVNKINVSKQDREWITNKLLPELERLGDRGIIIGRATASPEGPYGNNNRLAQQRRQSVDVLLKDYGFDVARIAYDVVAEDYDLLLTMMRINHDPDFSTIETLRRLYADDQQKLKEVMKKYNGGRLWRRLLKEYFPKLRAVRIMASDKVLDSLRTMPWAREALPCQSFINSYEIHYPTNIYSYTLLSKNREHRELLSIKTNLLLDFAYVAGYNRFCPIPNVAIEYYPLHGHFTYGASFDGPWWQNYDKHKYFQLRNYQLYTRYYLRSGDIAIRKPGTGAAFKGLFFSAYAHAFIYNICFSERRGWEGEGIGGGLGIGYSLPLGKNEHWRLEFGLQAGYFYTPYDPYQWRCPINPDADREQYYYKWYGNAKDFKKRQHRYSWIGPTRAEITLSYDIIYRKIRKKHYQ